MKSSFPPSTQNAQGFDESDEELLKMMKSFSPPPAKIQDELGFEESDEDLYDDHHQVNNTHPPPFVFHSFCNFHSVQTVRQAGTEKFVEWRHHCYFAKWLAPL